MMHCSPRNTMQRRSVDAFHRFPSHYPRLSFNALEQKASVGEERSPRENLVEKELDTENVKTVCAFVVHQIDALENELLECMQTTSFTNDQADSSHKFRAALSKAEGEILRLDEYFLTALGCADTNKEIDDITRACAIIVT